jgi:hypothetical protein
MTRETAKLTVNLAPEVLAALRNLAARRGTSMTEALRQAISVQQVLIDGEERGKKVVLENLDGTDRERLIIP